MGEERTKLFQMRSRISWIKSLKEEDPSMRLTKSESALKLKRWNCNLLLKKQRQPWSKRRTRSSGARWSLLKLSLRLTAALLKRMRNLEWLGKTRQRHWTPCNAPLKQKLEADAADLSLALEHAIAGNAETQNTIKKYQNQVRDAQLKVDEESAARSAAADAKVTADRKAAAMQNALEESRALLETADRQRRSAEQELADTNETLADLGNVNQSIAAAKRKLESEFNQLGADLDEMTNEARLSEEKAARAMVDAARLSDELRCEQDVAMNLEKDKKLLEAQCKDAGARADEAEVNALKGGRKAMIKMETRIRELESELDAKSRRNGDICKNLRKSERTIKELTFAGDEDKKNHERMQALIDQLQGKVKSYKKQIEEAEEIAALNLAKYRKVAGALGDAAAEADANEQAAAMRKARARSASLV